MPSSAFPSNPRRAGFPLRCSTSLIDPGTIAFIYVSLSTRALDTGKANAAQYLDNRLDNVSALTKIDIAMSGRSWRALQSGAGAVQVFDSRTNNKKSGSCYN